MDSFNEVDELEVWANNQGLSDDSYVIESISRLKARDKILSFTNVNLLQEWALFNNKIFDQDVRNRLCQLETPISTAGKKVS